MTDIIDTMENKLDKAVEKINALDKTVYLLCDTSKRTLDVLSDIQFRLRVLEQDRSVKEGEKKIVHMITDKWLAILLSGILAISLGLHQAIIQFLKTL
jgi:hypothetical protein